MKYYKIIDLDKFIGVVSSDDFRAYQVRHNFLKPSNEEYGQFVEYNDVLYRDTWMVPVEQKKLAYKIVRIEEISQEEYEGFKAAIEEVGEIEIPAAPTQVGEPVAEEKDPNEQITLEFAKELKINEANKKCNETIERGFDLSLTMGETKHFSLSVYDQLNLAAVANMIAMNQNAMNGTYLYHADGEEYRMYDEYDMNRIIERANAHRLQNLEYCDKLKRYINSLDDIKEILSIEYGVVIL